jgi:hypothetical protein
VEAVAIMLIPDFIGSLYVNEKRADNVSDRERPTTMSTKSFLDEIFNIEGELIL